MDLEKQEQERIKAQDLAEQLSKENKHLLLQWATGVGKGKAVMQCIAASPSPKQWLIVVPEIIQIENYKRDMKKHGYDWLLDTKINKIICYASLEGYSGSSYNLGLNEVHRVSDLREKVVKSIDFDQIISDSATVSEQIQRKLWDICPFYDYEITLNEAIERGILPPPNIYTIPIRLDSVKRRNSVKFGKTTKLLTDYSTAKYYDNNYKYWMDKYESEEGAEWMLNRAIKVASIRKAFLAKCKTDRAKKLLSSLEGKRVVCFVGSVEQAEELGEKNAVYSAKGKTYNLATIDKFNRKESNLLVFNKMGKEGMNLTDIECGVIVQLDSGNDAGLSFLQRMGRALRGVDPDIYILYAEGTHDEKYLERALKHVDKQYVKNYV